MRGYLILAAAIGFFGGTLRGTAADDPAAWQGSGLIARIHFAGMNRVLADPDAANLSAIAALPETAALREETLRKLAIAPYNLLRDRTANTNDEAALIRPLLEDLLRQESFLEVLDTTDAVPELILAARVDASHPNQWRDNLGRILASWTGIPVTSIKADGFDGLELKKHEDPNVIRLFRAGDWVVFGWGEGDVHLQAGILDRIQQTKRPVDALTNAWLDAWVNWPALAKHHLAPESMKLPVTRLVVQGRKGFVRSEMTMKFAESLGVKLNPWQIPTNVIQNPIVSFSAWRGLTPRFGEFPGLAGYKLPPLPDQAYIWSMSEAPTQTQIAAPVSNASNYLARLEPGLVSLLNTFFLAHKPSSQRIGPVPEGGLRAVWNEGEVQISQVPFLAPYVRANDNARGHYLMAGLMPIAPTRQPLPPDLIAEVNKNSRLVYYGWELTEERLKQWHGLTQLWTILFATGMSSPPGAAETWSEAMWPKLGNCGTEMSLTAPDELTLVRNSAIGLTGIEITALIYWLDAPGFPLSMQHERTVTQPLPADQPGQPH